MTGENRYVGRTQRFSEFVSGLVRVQEDGAVELASTHGSCRGGRVVNGTAVVDCPSIIVRIGPSSGTASVSVHEEQEVRSSRCAASVPSHLGGTPPVCIRYDTEINQVVRFLRTSLAVTRDS